MKSVFVKAMTNGKELGLRIEWSDQTQERYRPLVPRTSGIRRRSCSRSTRLERHPSSAWSQSGGTTNIWRWNAEWQKDLGKDSAGIWDVDDQYPGIFWDFYFTRMPAGGVTYPDRIGRSLGPFNLASGRATSCPTRRCA